VIEASFNIEMDSKTGGILLCGVPFDRSLIKSWGETIDHYQVNSFLTQVSNSVQMPGINYKLALDSKNVELLENHHVRFYNQNRRYIEFEGISRYDRSLQETLLEFHSYSVQCWIGGNGLERVLDEI
jgi:hypothetical protein